MCNKNKVLTVKYSIETIKGLRYISKTLGSNHELNNCDRALNSLKELLLLDNEIKESFNNETNVPNCIQYLPPNKIIIN